MNERPTVSLIQVCVNGEFLGSMKTIGQKGNIFFLRSVFLTSEKFVDETNTPKFYFFLASVLVFIIINARSRKPITIGAFTSKTTLWGIYIVCFLQACYGLFQLAGWFPSNHSNFAITGSFDNPAGFTAVLSLGFPQNKRS